MTAEKYEFEGSDSEDYFEFISHGPKGEITKAVQFTLIDEDAKLYNLGMGDLDPLTGNVLDDVTTDNKDTEKILNTVGEIARQFIDKKPNCSILIEGNSNSRNRLYRIGINKNLDIIAKKYRVIGIEEQNLKWERFIKNTNYLAFIISKRS
jgi:hypothetical protein